MGAGGAMTTSEAPPQVLAPAARALGRGSARFLRQSSAGSQLPDAPSPISSRSADESGLASPPPAPLARSRTGGLAAVARAVSHGSVRFVRRGSEHSSIASGADLAATAADRALQKVLVADAMVPAPPSAPSMTRSAAAASAAPPLLPGGLIGVSLAGFRAFVEAHGGRRAFVGKTTNDVKHAFVLPYTEVLQRSYAEVVHAAGSIHVGCANRFISHVYSAPFLKALDAIEAWEEQQSAAGQSSLFFYYFDLLVVNQWGQGPVIPFDVLRDEFSRGVQGVGHTLLLMEWAEATALTRMWCVFEIYTTLACRVPLDVIMAPEDETAFVEALHSDFESLVQKTIIHAELATAREPADEENIRRAIMESVGFEKLNQLVIRGLQQWMVARGVDALHFRRRTLGGDHPHTLAFTNNVASLLRAHGDYGRAEQLFQEVLVARRNPLGAMHSDTVRSMLHLCEVVRAQGRENEAAALFDAALESGRAALDDDLAKAAAGPSSLGNLLLAQSRMREAVERLREALESLRQALGDEEEPCPSRPQSMSSDTLVFALGLLGTAELTLRGRISESHGPSHASAAAYEHILCSLLEEQGRLEEAGRLLRDALAAGRRMLHDACAPGRALTCLPTVLDDLGVVLNKLRVAGPLLRGAPGAAAYARALCSGIGTGQTSKPLSPSAVSLAPPFSDSLRCAQDRLDEAGALLREAHALSRDAIASGAFTHDSGAVGAPGTGGLPVK